MAPPPAPLAAAERAAPSLRSTQLIVFGLLLFAIAVILLLRYLLRRWAAASLHTHTHTRRAGGVAGQGVPVDRDDQADAGAAGRRHVEAEAGLARRIASAAATTAEEEEAQPVREQVEPEAGTDDDTERLIASLPLFTTASPLAALKNSPDCAVCLSPFDDGTKLRLLSACRHAFHAACIDTWLPTNLVCPIYRSAISSPLPPLPVAALGDHQEPEATTVAKSVPLRVVEPGLPARRATAMGRGGSAPRGLREEEEPWALVALTRWILGFHDC